ncbi:MAG: hypothetical protein H0Z29_11785 [Candidatus Marinimicrobia bacterium]|nr:hypothetical protein [Candidatus Neomarinimicrobiota bacterium]
MNFLKKIAVKVVLSLYLKFEKSIWRIVAESYKTRLGKCGKNVKFNGKIFISRPELLEIEDNVHIGHNASILSGGKVYIGANTHIGPNLVI